MFWFETRTWSLFDLGADIGEAKDLASERPDELRALAGELRDWLAATNAPMPRVIGGEPVPLPDLPK